MKMREIKKKFKQFLAGGLMVCLMMPSFAGATWADVEDNSYAGVTKECLIDMNLEALQENIEYAISYDVRFNSSVMKFDSEDEELVKQYEKLFSPDKNQEPLYYVNYDFGENVIPAGAKVSVLVRKRRANAAEGAQAPETEREELKAQVATPAEASKVESAEASIDVSSNIIDSETAQTEHQEAAESEPVRTEVQTGAESVITSEETPTETTSRGTVQIEVPGSADAATVDTEITQVETSETAVTEPATENVTTENVITENATTENVTTENATTENTQAEILPATDNTEPAGHGTDITKTVAESWSEISSAEPAEPAVPAEPAKSQPAKLENIETAAVAEENHYNTATESDADEQRAEDYRITGKEEIILFFQNKSIDDYIFQINIGNRQTGKIYVPSASVLMEEAGLVKKSQEALESLEADKDIAGGSGNSGGGAGNGSSGGTDGGTDGGTEGTDETSADTIGKNQESDDHSQETSSGEQEAENGSQSENGDVQKPSNETQAPEADEPVTENNDQASEADNNNQVPESEDNNQDPGVNVPEANAPEANVPEANAPEADNQDQDQEAAPAGQEPGEGLEISISNHQVPRVAAPVAGEVNDEDFENRPDAGNDEEVSYSDGYVESTDPNEELGVVLDALLYKEKSGIMRFSLSSSSRRTSGASVSFLMSEVQTRPVIKTDFQANLFRYGKSTVEYNDYAAEEFYEYISSFNTAVNGGTDPYDSGQKKGNGGSGYVFLNPQVYSPGEKHTGLVQGIAADHYSNGKIAYDIELGKVKTLFPDSSQGSLVKENSGIIEEAYYDVDISDGFKTEMSADNSYYIYTFDSTAAPVRKSIDSGNYTFSVNSEWYGPGFWPLNNKKDRLEDWEKNYYYGIQHSTAFIIPENKKHSNGDDVIFTFSGNADIWVYLNDGSGAKLALDMGGMHDNITGTINFTTGLITYRTADARKLVNYKLTDIESGDGTNIYWYLYDKASLDALPDSVLGIDKSNIEKTVGLSHTGNQDYTMDYYMVQRNTVETDIRIQYAPPIANSNTKGSLTIKKELDAANSGTIAEGMEFTYDVKIENLQDTAVVTLGGETLPVNGGMIETSISIAPGHSKTFSGLTVGSIYTVKQTGVTTGTILIPDEIIITGGEGSVDHTSGIATGVIAGTQGSITGNIIWDFDKKDWYDEAGNLVGVKQSLGDNFRWHTAYSGQLMTTAELLDSLNGTEKVIFNLEGGGIDIYSGNVVQYASAGGVWYYAGKRTYGRDGEKWEEIGETRSKDDVTQFLGNHLIEWVKQGSEWAAVAYPNCWKVKPAIPLDPVNFMGVQQIIVTYRGSSGPISASFVLKKQLVTSPDNTSLRADHENQTFLYRIENMDITSAHAGEVFYAAITVDKGQTEASTTVSNVPAGSQYKITELENLRYLPVNGESQTINTGELTDDIVFIGYKAYEGYFSDTNVIVNRVTNGDSGIFRLATDYPDGQPLNLNAKLTPPPALLPDKSRSGLSDGGDMEPPAE